MSRPLRTLRRFFSELRRRRIWRVAAVYAATGFVVIQVADLTFTRLGLPGWTVTLVIALVALGFPVALVLAWAFELTPDGVRRTGTEAERGPPGPQRSQPISPLAALALGALLVAAGASAWWLQSAGETSAAAIDRLAVLPLANLTEDPEQTYFVQGMHDRLIAELQQAGVPVIARTSVMRYAEGETPVREVARELGVDGVVEGTVLRYGDSVEIEARLVDPETEQYVWRRAFSGSLRNVVSLHRDMARAIADEIQAALTPEDEARLARQSPVEPEAYEAYLRGEFHLQRFTPEDFTTALDYYEQALAIDSTYAPAYVGVARVWGFRAQASAATGVTAAEAADHSLPALERALALDRTLAEAHAFRAAVHAWGQWQFAEALSGFRRALELNPGMARQRMFYSHLLTILGRWEEAREQAERAVEDDPLNPFVQGLYGVHLVSTRRYEETIRVLERMFERHPDAGFGRPALAAAYEQTGRFEEAIRLRSQHLEAWGLPRVAATLEQVYRRDGYREASRVAADSLSARAEAGSLQPGPVAFFYARAREDERAITWFRKMVEVHDQNAPYLGLNPTLEHLHENPRFRALVEDSVGVPLLTGPAGDPQLSSGFILRNSSSLISPFATSVQPGTAHPNPVAVCPSPLFGGLVPNRNGLLVVSRSEPEVRILTPAHEFISEQAHEFIPLFLFHSIPG